MLLLRRENNVSRENTNVNSKSIYKILETLNELIKKYGNESVESAILILEDDKTLNLAPFPDEDEDEDEDEE